MVDKVKEIIAASRARYFGGLVLDRGERKVHLYDDYEDHEAGLAPARTWTITEEDMVRLTDQSLFDVVI